MAHYSRLEVTKRGQSSNRYSRLHHRGALSCINIILFATGVFLICIPSYNKHHIYHFTSSQAITGFTKVSGVIIIGLSLLALIGISKQSQLILHVYMVIMIVMFIVLLTSSAAAASFYSSYQLYLIRARLASNKEQGGETMTNCCASLKGDHGAYWCNAITLVYGPTTSCYFDMIEVTAKAGLYLGGIGLIFASMLGAGAYASAKYRDQLRKAATV